jgi:hypothetical protein
LVLQETGDELLVYDLETNKAICLNETSAFIWQICDGKNNINKIREAVEKKFGELITEDFIKLALSQLEKEDLIVNNDGLGFGFDGMSRREVIKKVGLSSMIALPIISSLVAPPASYAASACVVNTQCTCVLNNTVSNNPCNGGEAAPMTCVGGCTCMQANANNNSMAGRCSM